MQQVRNVTNKWGDWAIVKVDYDQTDSHIETVWARSINDDGSLNAKLESFTREAVVNAIERGSIVKTAYLKPGASAYTRGALVQVVTIGGKKFLHTTPNRTPKDNLENL